MARARAALLTGLFAGSIAVSCTSGPTDGASTLDAGPAARIPDTHRSSGAVCPQERAAGALAAGCAYDGGVSLACTQDGDCITGDNGRCLPTPGVTCAPECSYDTCQSDADCNGGPCVCRTSGSDSTANACAPGNCAVDSDCGPSGYCSPSGLLDACGLGYYCHTTGDACLDDGDCPHDQGCSFDPHTLAWACAVTCTLPP